MNLTVQVNHLVIKPLEVLEMVGEHHIEVKCSVNIPFSFFYLLRTKFIMGDLLNHCIHIYVVYILDFSS